MDNSNISIENKEKLPNGWTIIPFDQAVMSIPTTGKKVKQRDYLLTGKLPVIDQGQDFIGGYTNIETYKINYDSPIIIFGDHTKIFKYVNFSFAPGADGIRIFKPYSFFSPKLLYYFLQALDLPDRGYSRHYQFLRKQFIPLPPLPEQQRIVDAIETQLTRLDAAVAALERVKANLVRYKASVLQAACEGRLVPTEAELARREGFQTLPSNELAHGTGGSKTLPYDEIRPNEAILYEPADILLQRILAERRRKWEAEQWETEIERAQKKAVQAARKAAGRPSRLSDIPDTEWQAVPEEDYAAYLPKSDRWKEKYQEPAKPDMEGLPDLPEGWVWGTVEQVGDVIGGLTKNQKRKSYTFKLPYLRVANVYANELRLDDIEEIGVKEKEINRVLLQKGDLLVVEGNGSVEQIGRVAIWNGSIDPCLHQNHIIKVRFNIIELAEYILLWFLSIGGRDQIIDVASSTSGLYTLNLTKVAALHIPLPPLKEQHRIVEEVERRLSVVTEIERAVEANLARAARLRQSILKRAFEGKLVPQDPDDEPARALLGRISVGEGLQPSRTTHTTKQQEGHRPSPTKFNPIQLDMHLD